MTRLGTSTCTLCPRMCKAERDRGKRGLCGAADEVLVARAALHFWEEPPLSGTSGSGAIFFSYCPLRCVYCQNAAIASGNAGKAVSVERLAQICLELQEAGAMNVNFVTPTHYSLKIREAVMRARENGLAIPVLWNTSGYERREAIEALEDTVDVYLTDFKYSDAGLAMRYSKAPDYPEVALDAIGAMLDAVGLPVFDEYNGQVRLVRGVVVRHLVLPGSLDNSKRALEMLYDRYGDSVLYSIMNQYTPMMPKSALSRFPELADRVSDSEYEELLVFADELGMDDYFWQEGTAALESFIPEWDGTGA